MTNGQLVVIIDDDRLNNLVCRKLIEIVGNGATPTVIDFTDPTRGLGYVRSCCSTLHSDRAILFLDLNMPVMSGWNFLDEFDKLDEHCKAAFTIFIITSSVDPNDRRRAAKDPNVAGLIVKPLTREVMRHLLN